MTGCFTRLAELSVHAANVQEGQIVLVAAEIGLEEQARATAEAAYKRGAKFVDGFPFLIEVEDRERSDVSAQHIDFMIGLAEMEVDGVTVYGERIPVLRNHAWQI
jgi:leucyl aminopeptidase (aminopeptidase T)